jgi:hypothetical protein
MMGAISRTTRLLSRVRRSAIALWHLLLRLRASGPSLTGNPWVEATIAFDRALAAHRRHAHLAAIARDAGRMTLPTLEQELPPGQVPVKHPPDDRVIAVADIVGTAGGGLVPLDSQFLPVDGRFRGRFTSAFAAMYRGDPMPPIEVYEWRSRYYVGDGHHRVAAARALGQEFIDARVTDVTGTPVSAQPPHRATNGG